MSTLPAAKRLSARARLLITITVIALALAGTATWRLFREAGHPAPALDLGAAGTAADAQEAGLTATADTGSGDISWEVSSAWGIYSFALGTASGPVAMLDDVSGSDPAARHVGISRKGIALVGLNAEDGSVRWYRRIKALPDNRPDPADSAPESQHSKDFVLRFIQTSPDGRYVSLALAPVISSSSPRRYIPQRGHSSSDQEWSQTVAVFSADTGELGQARMVAATAMRVLRRHRGAGAPSRHRPESSRSRPDEPRADRGDLSHLLPRRRNSDLLSPERPRVRPLALARHRVARRNHGGRRTAVPAQGHVVLQREGLPHSDAEYRRCHHRPGPAHGGSRLPRRPGRMGGALRRHEQRHGHSKHPRLVPDPPRPGEPRLGRPRRHHRAIGDGDGLPNPYRQDPDTQLLDLGADGETAHRASHPRLLAAPPPARATRRSCRAANHSRPSPPTWPTANAAMSSAAPHSPWGIPDPPRTTVLSQTTRSRNALADPPCRRRRRPPRPSPIMSSPADGGLPHRQSHRHILSILSI